MEWAKIVCLATMLLERLNCDGILANEGDWCIFIEAEKTSWWSRCLLDARRRPSTFNSVTATKRTVVCVPEARTFIVTLPGWQCQRPRNSRSRAAFT